MGMGHGRRFSRWEIHQVAALNIKEFIRDPESVAIVLGGGGLVGISYHIGALRALQDLGLDLNKIGLVIGTSAGSVVGAYLRKSEMMTRYANEDLSKSIPNVMHTKNAGRGEQIKLVASSVACGIQSIVRIPLVPIPPVKSLFESSGIFGLNHGKNILETELKDTWPQAPIWIVAQDLLTGARKVFGRDDFPRFYEAVLASCAIPGIYAPVKINNRLYVDGGAYSNASLDLAISAGFKNVIAIIPMGYNKNTEISRRETFIRNFALFRTSKEIDILKKNSANLVLIFPSEKVIALTDLKFMQTKNLESIKTQSYSDTLAFLRDEPTRE
jgi:NTE family protein